MNVFIIVTVRHSAIFLGEESIEKTWQSHRLRYIHILCEEIYGGKVKYNGVIGIN